MRSVALIDTVRYNGWMTFLPWWLGGAVLAGVALTSLWWTGRPLGVSGQIGRVLDGAETTTTRITSIWMLTGIVIGGAAVSIARGGWSSWLGRWSQSLSVDTCAAALLGGALVGVGTTIAQGCTAGHGLMGCARVQRPSLLATSLFFGTAILTALLMQQVRP
jgi:uncharacterized protein